MGEFELLLNNSTSLAAIMPKRTRDDEVKGIFYISNLSLKLLLRWVTANRISPTGDTPPSAQLSAFARRQLLQAKTSAPAPPAPALSARATPAPAPSTIGDATPLRSSNKKLKDSTADTLSTGEKPPTSSALKSSGSHVSAREKLESALSRQLEATQQGKEEGLIAAEDGGVKEGNDMGDVMSVDGDEWEDGVDPQMSANGRGRANSIATQISSFVPTQSNPMVYKPGLSMKYSLKANEAVVFQGEYSLRVLLGSIKIYGATLTPSSGTHGVWAPSTHALPVIEALPGKREAKMQEMGAEFDAEIVVGSFNSGIRDIGRLWPMLGEVWTPSYTADTGETYHLLTTSIPPPSVLTTPSAWLPLLSDFTTPSPQPPVILIAGPKSSGKSSLSRTLTNTLLNTYPKVAYLDLDPGQPEFTPPGMVSLSVLSTPILGPPFTHPAGPVSRGSKRHRAHHLGFVSPREDPGMYIQATGDLFRAYTHLHDLQNDSSLGIPLVVNTCGWIKGTGLELLHDIINITQPSDLIFLHPPPQYPSDSASAAISDIQALLSHTTRFCHIPPPASMATQARLSAADLRTLHTISYFHHSVVDGVDDHEPRISWTFTKPLTHALPWVLPGREIGAGIHILHLTPPLPPQLLRDAIEGTIVGVVLLDNVNSSSTEDQENADRSGLPYPFPGPPPTPGTSHCAGLAVIRAIGTATNEVQLILPPKDMYLSEASSSHEGLALVRGRLEGSVWDFVSQELRAGRGSGEEVPWVTCDGAAGQGGKGVREWRVRRNLMRRGQLRGGSR